MDLEICNECGNQKGYVLIWLRVKPSVGEHQGGHFGAELVEATVKMLRISFHLLFIVFTLSMSSSRKPLVINTAIGLELRVRLFRFCGLCGFIPFFRFLPPLLLFDVLDSFPF